MAISFNFKQGAESSLSLDVIFSKLYQLPDKVQYCHHNTTSYAAHKALDGAYDDLSSLKDSIVEKLIGYTGKRPSSLKGQDLVGYTEGLNTQVASEIMQFGEALEEWAEELDYCDIENLAQEYNGVGAQLAYLLSLK